MAKTPYDSERDYVKDLKKNEVYEKDEEHFVYLRGLQRLARERGIKRTESKVRQCPATDHPVAVVTYGFEFEDGAYYEASADAHQKNVKPEMVIYLTAIAEARAKARALRDAFGISLCSVEELGSQENKENEPIDDTQIQGIKMLMKRKGLTPDGTLALIGKNDVGDFSELSKADGRILMKKLNELKIK
jgi:hypothetical protein